MEQYLLILGFKAFDRPTAAEAKERWKQLCRKHHPDVGGSEEEFKKVTHAYKMVTDSEYRYKEVVKEANKKPNMFGDLNIRMQLNISFDVAFFGKDSRISYNVIEYDDELNVIEKENIELESVKVQIPAGVDNGYVVHLGSRGHRKGESRGDLFINITVAKHGKFERNGADVTSTEALPLDLLLKGGVVEVLTMYGIKKLKIPPGTQPGSEFEIKRSGLFKRGVHIVTVQPIYPTAEDLRGEKWRGLPIDWSVPEPEEVDPEEVSFDEIFKRFSGTVTVGGFEF